MVETIERRSALAGMTPAGVSGAARNTATPGLPPGLVVTELRDQAILHLSAQTDDKALAAAVEAATGSSLPITPNTTAENAFATLLWLAPYRWLLVAPGQAEDKLAEALRAAAPENAVNGVGHGRTVLRLAGPAVRDVLSKGCPLDLHPRAFPPGDCAQSHIGPVNGLIHPLGDGSAIDVYIARGYAISFWDWLTKSAAEYGYSAA